MTARMNSPAARGPIYLLQDDRPRSHPEAAAFDAAPFRNGAPSSLLPVRSRLVEDADGWALWRTERLELEQALAVHESCRALDPDAVDELRDRLADMERRVCDARPAEIMSELSALQRQVLVDCDAAED